jgi:hypothetical protein
MRDAINRNTNGTFTPIRILDDESVIEFTQWVNGVPHKVECNTEAEARQLISIV